MCVGTVSDPNITTLAKRIHYRGHSLCLHAFSVLVAGLSESYRKTSVANTMAQIMRETQPQNGAQHVDPQELFSRKERSEMLHDLAQLESCNFARDCARAFCVDHMDLLCCHNPENGDKELDTAVMQSTYEVYQAQCVGADSVSSISKCTFERILRDVIEEFDFKVRDKKTVSKCETCES